MSIIPEDHGLRPVAALFVVIKRNLLVVGFDVEYLIGWSVAQLPTL